MTGFAKFCVGVVATSLLAWGAHALTGQDYIHSLDQQAKTALLQSEAAGVSVSMQDDPLARIALLSGAMDPQARFAAEAAVLGVPGVHSARWTDAEIGPVAVNSTASASLTMSCQGGIDEVIAGKVIHFRSGSAYMPDSSLAVVGEVAQALAACEGTKLTVGGHTDATGSEAINRSMSQARADRVAAALVERGIAAERIAATGYGATQLLVDGAGEQANAANRRITFTIGRAGPPAPSQGEPSDAADS